MAQREFVKCGATGYTATPCSGVGQSQIQHGEPGKSTRVRIEIIAPVDVCDAMVDFLRNEILPEQNITACIETVDVVRVGHFTPPVENVPQELQNT